MTPLHSLWALSLLAEAAALATYWRRGGFVAFRVMLAADILFQCADIAASGTIWYRPVYRVGDMAVGILTAFAVLESAPNVAGSLRRAVTAAGIAALCHIIMYDPAWWSSVAGFVLAFIALGHSVMGIWMLLGLCEMPKIDAHRAVLTAYLAAVSICFYLAPSFAEGRWVMGVNLLCWVAFAWPGERSTCIRLPRRI